MKRDQLIVLAILAWLLWPKRSTSVNLFQTCVWSDGTTIDVPLGDACPLNSQGEQSVLVPAS